MPLDDKLAKIPYHPAKKAIHPQLVIGTYELCRGHFNMINDRDVDQPLCRLKLELRLFRNCGEDERSGSVRVGVNCNAVRRTRQLEIAAISQASIVDNNAAQPLFSPHGLMLPIAPLQVNRFDD
jgi:hypothetical protein